jgi:Cytochrome c7 and related cytochrome c
MNPGRIAAALLLAGAVAGVAACGLYGESPSSRVSRDAVFTPARPSLSAAVSDFFGWRPDPVQPIPFPHNVHVGKKIGCTEYCHEGVTAGPIAGLPSVKTCLICHETFATDKPVVQTFTKLHEQGRDIAWQRVYGYPAPSHVRFNHAPHIRAGVECATCHGDVASQTVAGRNVDLNMGFCVNCHTQRKAPNECVTCHY